MVASHNNSNPLALFLLRRISLALVTLLLLTIIVFALSNVLPQNVGRAILGPFAPQESVDELNQRLGTDKPLVVQYLNQMKGYATLDFGESYTTREPVTKVIKTTLEHERARARLEELFTAKPRTPEGDEFELLLLLVETYEAKEYPIELPDPIEAIRFRMEQAKLKQKDLIPILGSKGKVSEVLNGKRELSLTMIRKLVSELGIPAEVLLQERGATLPDTDILTFGKK